MVLIFGGLLLCLVLLVMSLRQFALASADRRQAMSGTLDGTVKSEAPGSRLNRLSRRFTQTRLGRALERDLVLAGVSQPPLVVFAVLVTATVVVPYVLAQLLAPLFAIVGLAAGWILLRTWLRRSRERRRERFVSQIPELARVLSNATNAGLSIATAWGVAEHEMAEPAKTEIQRLNAALRFGSSLEEAMLQINERLPAREVRVLMSTLVVSSRSGGSLVKALREISLTLDERKETRREIRTTLAQARATSMLVILMGFGLLLLLNAIQPGTVERMTHNIIGQIALLIGFALFGLGFILVRRMTRVDI